MRKTALILIQVLTVIVSTETATRITHDIKDTFANADKESHGFVKFYDASCVMDSQCLDYVANCYNKAGLSDALSSG